MFTFLFSFLDLLTEPPLLFYKAGQQSNYLTEALFLLPCNLTIQLCNLI